MRLGVQEWPDTPDYRAVREPCDRGIIHEYQMPLDHSDLILRWGDFVIEENGMREQQINASVDLGGCSMHCGFCASPGKSDFQTLSANDIVHQIAIARENEQFERTHCPSWSVGFLGEGENADDPGALAGALHEVSTWKNPPRSVLISTTGKDCVHFMLRMSDTATRFSPGTMKLQVSATSVRPAVRAKAMPDSPPLEFVLPHAEAFAKKTGTQVKFNFPLMKGKNDSAQDLDGIIALVRRNPWILPKISSYNSIGKAAYVPASTQELRQFHTQLIDAGIDAQLFIADTAKHAMNCGTVTALQDSTRTSLNVLP